MNNSSGGKIMIKFVGLRANIYSSLIGDGSEDKIAKGTKKCAIKDILNWKIIKTVQKQMNLRIK